MTHSLTSKAQLSDVDIAYQLLISQGRSMYYYDLIQGVLQMQNLPMNPETVSSVLTQINLDTRFAYVGKGEWGLKAWIPSRGSRKFPTISLMNKEITYDDSEMNTVEEKDPLNDEELDDDLDEELEDELDEEDEDVLGDSGDDEDSGIPSRIVDDSWE